MMRDGIEDAPIDEARHAELTRLVDARVQVAQLMASRARLVARLREVDRAIAGLTGTPVARAERSGAAHHNDAADAWRVLREAAEPMRCRDVVAEVARRREIGAGDVEARRRLTVNVRTFLYRDRRVRRVGAGTFVARGV